MVSQTKADQMVARGDAVQVGVKCIKEKKLTPRGELRHWQGAPSYDPDTRVKVRVMQFIQPGCSDSTFRKVREFREDDEGKYSTESILSGRNPVANNRLKKSEESIHSNTGVQPGYTRRRTTRRETPRK